MTTMNLLNRITSFWPKRRERRFRKPCVGAPNGVHSVECPALSAAIRQSPGAECPCFRCPFGLRRNVAYLTKGGVQ